MRGARYVECAPLVTNGEWNNRLVIEKDKKCRDYAKDRENPCSIDSSAGDV